MRTHDLVNVLTTWQSKVESKQQRISMRSIFKIYENSAHTVAWELISTELVRKYEAFKVNYYNFSFTCHKSPQGTSLIIEQVKKQPTYWPAALKSKKGATLLLQGVFFAHARMFFMRWICTILLGLYTFCVVHTVSKDVKDCGNQDKKGFYNKVYHIISKSEYYLTMFGSHLTNHKYPWNPMTVNSAHSRLLCHLSKVFAKH